MSQKTRVIPSATGGIWLGNQASLDQATAAQVKLDGTSLIEQIDMRTRATELRVKMESAEDQYAGHYMIDVYDDSVGVIDVSGSLINHPLPLRVFGMGVTTYGEIQRAVMLLSRDSNITDVVLAVSSGGGSASGMYATSNLLGHLAKTKRLHTFADTAMGSAAYYLGVNGSTIYSDRMALVGSVGVYMTMVSRAKALEDEGYDVRIVRAGEFKAMGNSAEPISEEALAVWQKVVDESYADFLEHAAGKRGQQVETFRTRAAEGREFFGTEAKSVGLVDEVMVFNDAIEAVISAKGSKTSIMTPRSGGNSTGQNLQSVKGDVMNEKMRKLLEAAGIELSSEQETALTMGTDFFDLGLNLSAELTEQLQAAAEESDEESGEEGGEEEGGEEEGGEGAQAASAATPSTDFGQMLDRITDLTTKLAAVTAEKAQLAARVTTLEAAAESAATEMAAIRPLAEENVRRMSVALRKGEPNLAGLSVADLVLQHADLQATFNTVFPSGRKSQGSQTKPQSGRPAVSAELMAAAQKATQL